MKMTMATIAFILTSLPVQPNQGVPAQSELEAHPENFTRCGYKHTTLAEGLVKTEAICVWTDDVGNAYVVAVPVECDDECVPSGAPRVTEFYE